MEPGFLSGEQQRNRRKTRYSIYFTTDQHLLYNGIFYVIIMTGMPVTIPEKGMCLAEFAAPCCEGVLR